MVELLGRRKFWMVSLIGLGVAAGAVAWLAGARSVGPIAGSEGGDVVVVALVVYLCLAARREELSPAVRRRLMIAVGVATIAGASVFYLTR
jgi:hypothetical protein